MKIGILTDPLYESSGGIARYTSNIIKNLENDKENDYCFINFRKVNFLNYGKEIIIPSFFNPERDIIRKTILLPAILKKEKFDIFHSLSQFGLFWSKIGKKNILTIHDLIPIISPEIQSKFNYFSYKYILPKVLKNVDIIITISENSKRDIIKYLKIPEEKIEVVYHGVDKVFRPIKKAKRLIELKYGIESPFLFHVTVDENRTNLKEVIKTLSIIKDNGFKHKLVVSGKLKNKNNILEIIKNKNLMNDVIFTGFVPDYDLALLFNSADMFVYPSNYEGFGLPVIEAMACGCPVITSSSGSLPEIVGNAGIVLSSKNDASIAKSITELMNDNTRIKRLINRGFKTSKNFSWEKAVNEILKIYESI